MNIDKSSDDRTNLSLSTVVSKYFLDQPGMDESLSDFQETKQNCKGPKKCEANKSKPKKRIKRIKGQKDIRTALKSKNELVAFSNDFEKICKQSGIDVDSEELQLAIALSKSVQNNEPTRDENDDERSLTSQERVGKIKTTLQEYGFKVPVKKIATKNRKWKHKKPYKLLLTTESERQQLISSRYSEIIFGNVNTSTVEEQFDEFVFSLYNIATDVSYKILNNNNIFYISNLLFEKSENTIGSLLRNWSEIPGRPVSPDFKKSTKFNFTKMSYMQDKLDILLSGSFKCIEGVIDTIPCKTANEENINMSQQIISNTVENTEHVTKNISIEIDLTEGGNNLNINSETKTSSASEIEVRSCSPDMFDDDIPCVMTSFKSHSELSPKPMSVTEVASDFMDLTECVNNHNASLGKNVLPHKNFISQLSSTNITERRSNDFMEITDCIKSSSQSSTAVTVQDSIDLTQSCTPKYTSAKEKVNVLDNDVESTDLTQTSDSDSSLPLVYLSGKQNDSLDDTLIVNDENNVDGKSDLNQTTFNHRDDTCSNTLKLKLLTSNDLKTGTTVNETNIISIESDEETEDIVQFNANFESRENDNEKFNKSKTESFFEEFVHQHSSDQSKEESKEGLAGDESVNECNVSSKINEVELNNIISIESDEERDVLQFSVKYKSRENYLLKENEKYIKTKTDSFFEEFVYEYSSDQSEEANTECLVVDECVNETKVISKSNHCEVNSDIDLTQSSETSDVVLENLNNTNVSLFPHGTECLGKIGDVSIDYDDLFDNVVETCSSNTKQSNDTEEITDYNIAYDNKSISSTNLDKANSITSSSDNAEVFEISDKELNYSLSRSRNNIVNGNFDVGGLSVLDNITSNIRSSNSTSDNQTTNLGELTDDSYLPLVEIRSSSNNRKSPNKLCNMKMSTPFKLAEGNKVLDTPDNSEYEIRTDQITPIVDYASLTTPERNKELDKYGLKPFKRKRAIQLLTHLYNQTHPIVQACSSDDLPSPSKKLKTKHNGQPSPKKLSKSPAKSDEQYARMLAERELEENIAETNLYEVTNEEPEIRDVACCEQDWIFQKREKAKVHSCRVPLHISFHNYVSARPELRNAILRYEPVNIDDIHKGLVASGHRYDPKDLLRFMDKKCITVKTDANRNKRNL